MNSPKVFRGTTDFSGPGVAIKMQNSGKTIYVSNTRSDTVSIIDTDVDEVVAEVAQ